jgi:hypothetical protein
MRQSNNFKDLTGQKIGMLTIISRNTENTTSKKVRWNCICECGSKTIVTTDHLRDGHTKSCGCLTRKENRINRVGQIYNMLTVISLNRKGENGKIYWNCYCICGNTTVVSASNLVNGSVKSCGCLLKVPHNITHGQSKNRIGETWDNMKGRCYRPNNTNYKNYGGRGIKICDEWLNDSSSFFDWAFKNGYNDTLTIERIDTDGDYTPLNCTFIPKREQSKNRRNTLGQEIADKIRIEFKKGYSVKELAKKYNVDTSTIRYIKNGKHY